MYLYRGLGQLPGDIVATAKGVRLQTTALTQRIQSSVGDELYQRRVAAASGDKLSRVENKFQAVLNVFDPTKQIETSQKIQAMDTAMDTYVKLAVAILLLGSVGLMLFRR